MTPLVGLLVALGVIAVAAAAVTGIVLVVDRLDDHALLAGCWLALALGVTAGAVVGSAKLWHRVGEPWWWGPVLLAPVLAVLAWRTRGALRRDTPPPRTGVR